MAFKIKFEEVSFTNLNSVRVDTYSDEDLVNFIKSGYDEVKRLAELATISKSSAMQEEADNLTAQVIRVGVILDGRAKERLDKAEALANK